MPDLPTIRTLALRPCALALRSARSSNTDTAGKTAIRRRPRRRGRRSGVGRRHVATAPIGRGPGGGTGVLLLLARVPPVFVALETAEFFADEAFAAGVGFGVAGWEDVVGSMF